MSNIRSLKEFARRRWPIIAAVGIVVVAAWALSRSRPDREGAEVIADEQVPDTVVTLDSAAQRFAGITLATAGGGDEDGLVANATITYDANHASVVAPRAEGRVVWVRADLGQRVARGSVLAVLESPEVGQARGDVERARAALEVKRQNYERERRLYEQSISSQREMLEAEGEYRSAQADFNAATARLQSLGAADGRGAEYSLTSPIAGMVVERNAMPGQIAGAETNLFTVAHLQHLWITVDVYESDIARVRRGAAALVLARALPADTFQGRVAFAGGIVDTTSRTIRVRVEIDNADLRLRPGMFAEVRIKAPAGRSGGTVVVPELAVQDLNGRAVVFVLAEAPGHFIARPVTLGNRLSGSRVTIAAGLVAGERFVVRGAFQLRSELLKATFGEKEEK